MDDRRAIKKAAMTALGRTPERTLRHERRSMHEPLGIVVDTNVFVAAGFNPTSASARVLRAIREGRLRLIWNQATRRETEMILRRIPRLAWEDVADLFRPEGEFVGPTHPEAFAMIVDPDDRIFAALSAASNSPLVTNDNHLLAHQNRIGIQILTPSAFMA
jgi:uncharacterized protein